MVSWETYETAADLCDVVILEGCDEFCKQRIKDSHELALKMRMSTQKPRNLTSGFAMNANFGWKHVTESGHILNGNLRGLFLDIS